MSIEKKRVNRDLRLSFVGKVSFENRYLSRFEHAKITSAEDSYPDKDTVGSKLINR